MYSSLREKSSLVLNSLFIHFYSEVKYHLEFLSVYFCFLCSLSSSLYFYTVYCSLLNVFLNFEKWNTILTYLWSDLSLLYCLFHTHACNSFAYGAHCLLCILHLYSLFGCWSLSHGLFLSFLSTGLNTSPFILFFYSDEIKPYSYSTLYYANLKIYKLT